jgi:hypothetical protein
MPGRTPADRVIAAFGGVPQLAAATGIPDKTIYRWRYPKTAGGSDGLIPSDRQQTILDAARRAGLELVAADLIGSPAEAR